MQTGKSSRVIATPPNTQSKSKGGAEPITVFYGSRQHIAPTTNKHHHHRNDGKTHKSPSTEKRKGEKGGGRLREGTGRNTYLHNQTKVKRSAPILLIARGSPPPLSHANQSTAPWSLRRTIKPQTTEQKNTVKRKPPIRKYIPGWQRAQTKGACGTPGMIYPGVSNRLEAFFLGDRRFRSENPRLMRNKGRDKRKLASS